jgi:hypothetical protein
MNTTLVLHPATAFPQIERTLSGLGWVKRPNRAITPPMVPGEPEFASWSWTDETDAEERGRISYTFNPVVNLRVLVFNGARAEARCAEVENALPTLDTAALRELLQSMEPREVLLGIFAARELKEISVLDLLEPLTNHYEFAVARAAQEAREALVLATLELGAERLSQEKLQHPERSVLFPRLGDAPMRRQTIRWLIRDYEKSNKHIDEVLRSALVDEDWEVRASAMLAAVRLGATAVGPEVGRVTLPSNGSEGLDETDRSILETAHKIAVAHLAGKPIEVAAGDEEASRRRHLWNCMMGHSVEKHDHIFRFVNALTEPLETEND